MLPQMSWKGQVSDERTRPLELDLKPDLGLRHVFADGGYAGDKLKDALKNHADAHEYFASATTSGIGRSMRAQPPWSSIHDCGRGALVCPALPQRERSVRLRSGVTARALMVL